MKKSCNGEETPESIQALFFECFKKQTLNTPKTSKELFGFELLE